MKNKLIEALIFFLAALLTWFVFRRLGWIHSDVVTSALGTTVGWIIGQAGLAWFKKAKSKRS